MYFNKENNSYIAFYISDVIYFKRGRFSFLYNEKVKIFLLKILKRLINTSDRELATLLQYYCLKLATLLLGDPKAPQDRGRAVQGVLLLRL